MSLPINKIETFFKILRDTINRLTLKYLKSKNPKLQIDLGRFILKILAIFISILAILPIIGLLNEGFNGISKRVINLGIDGPNQIKSTLILLLSATSLGAIIGTVNGWLLANCRFSGRKIIRITQLIPLACPAYLFAATLIDLGSIHSIRITGIFWAIIIMALTTYPYVFLLTTESFSKSGKRQLEACRSLGIGPWESFLRIALPIAMPAIGAGMALMGMEIINELGAVQLLNVESVSAGIIENWVLSGNPTGAIGLALIALTFVITLVAYEKALRRRSRRWTEGLAGGESPAWELKGIQAIGAQLLGALPPIITLGTPLLWAISNYEQLGKGLNIDLLILTSRSLFLGLVAALITMVASILLTIGKRWSNSKFITSITFLAGIGYAIPGVVMAIALLSFSNKPWQFTPVFLLLWGYSARFLTVSKGGLDAAFERISPNLDEAAIGLGYNWWGVLKKVHLPLLKGPLIVGALLVFVDTIKELPLTFVLRPFDFDTLSVRIFQYASDERMAESLMPALIVLTLGLIASIALIPSLDKSFKENDFQKK